ncbi:MAG: carboxypeptidase-like regulatory domain-containing protein [Agarilytica sp.]
MKIIAVLLICVLLSGCYPVYKTLQPKSNILVVDESGAPLQGATVVLVSNAYPYGNEKTRMEVVTNYKGEARFPSSKEWRMEVMIMHGMEVYYWNWCVTKEGYTTYVTHDGNSKDFDRKPVVKLSKGATTKCPAKLY